MKTADSDLNRRKLMDKLGSPPQFGPLVGMLATTFEMQPEFFETDFLPTVLNLGAWDDRSWTSRIEIEKNLAHMETAILFLDASRYRNRPRSLRVKIMPVALGDWRALHAKVVLLVYENAVRLILGSANLTQQGYRENREVAAVLTVTDRDKKRAPLIRSALSGFPLVLGGWWGSECEQLSKLATDFLHTDEGNTTQEREWFFWGGGEEALWKSFVSRWPESDKVSKITIVSPFWSEDEKQRPLERLLSALREKECMEKGAEVRLITEATPDYQTSYKPTLPKTFGSFDFGAFGVAVTAQAADPQVLVEEVGVEGFVRNRPLHAKVVVFDGHRNSLHYLGSANFTRQGWGFVGEERKANVEAGLVILQDKKGTGAVSSLIPKGTGPVVELKGGAEAGLASPEPTPESIPWPSFLKEVLLSPNPNDPERLDLVIRWDRGLTLGHWEISSAEKGDGGVANVFLDSSSVSDSMDTHRVSLDEPSVNTLLKEQEVLVQWWEKKQGGQTFPVNVALEARHALPISPESGKFSEQRLILYYQGRIAWEDIFPEPADPTLQKGEEPGPEDETGTVVDTSRIQSYQIREFIEALRGITDDLKAAARSTEPAMRLALVGPVSPIALARVVTDAAHRKERSPLAAGFQLVEIRACIETARGFQSAEKYKMAWLGFIDEALTSVDKLFVRLREMFPSDFSKQGAFALYEQSIRNYYNISRATR
jgi:hypothetical protein